MGRIQTNKINQNLSAHEKVFIKNLEKFVPYELRERKEAIAMLNAFSSDALASLRSLGEELRQAACIQAFDNAATARLLTHSDDTSEYIARAFNSASRSNSAMQGIRKMHDINWEAHTQTVADAIVFATSQCTHTDLKTNITSFWSVFLDKIREQEDRSSNFNPNPNPTLTLTPILPVMDDAR